MRNDNWKETYKNKIVPVDQALSHIEAGNKIFIGTGCAAPQLLIEGLTSGKKQVADAEIYHLLTMGIAPYAQDMFNENYRFNSFFISDNVRDAVQEGQGDYTPIFLSEIPKLFEEGRTPLDVVLIQTTPPDENGMVSLGVSVDIVKSATENASLVIAEINPNMPWTCGDSLIPIDYIDYLVESDKPILTYDLVEVDDTIRRIGQNVASIIEDGSTVEVGIGAIPQAILEFLSDKKDLGIHTEMFTDQLIDLIESGVINGSKKLVNQGKVVASFLMGSKKLYDYVDNNPVIEMHPSEYVNDPFIIAKQPKMAAINVALEVDLTGQVCADSIGHRFYSGIGGQLDFIRGAARSKGGKPIIAMQSTTMGGEVSKIVANLSPGAGVVTTRGDVHYVVTEYGIADLHGKNIRERSMALISIAHPKFRRQLLEEAKKMKYVYDDQIYVETVSDEDPERYSQCDVIADGTEVTFRPIKATDEEAMRDLFYSLSEQSIYLRFFQPVESMPHAKIMPLVSINYKKDMAMVATIGDIAGEKIIGVGRYMRSSNDDPFAEVSFEVRDEWQNRGLGRAFLNSLMNIAEQHSIEGFVATVLPKNKQMMSVFRGCGCKLHVEKSGDVFELSFKFNEKA
ncbi:MAG: GNAT family N-acetyltransferase [Deltaproteobacteria bacterium]|jgi:acyl-CoA hydrolase/RimJ/RimL family protein N-acetyltransferase|nr:GNAT family N-acetyltransferase [Deltaproteobacteria bacterium]